MVLDQGVVKSYSREMEEFWNALITTGDQQTWHSRAFPSNHRLLPWILVFAFCIVCAETLLRQFWDLNYADGCLCLYNRFLLRIIIIVRHVVSWNGLNKLLEFNHVQPVSTSLIAMTRKSARNRLLGNVCVSLDTCMSPWIRNEWEWPYTWKGKQPHWMDK